MTRVRYEFPKGLEIPAERRAEIDAIRRAGGWSWRRLSVEADLPQATVYGAVHRAFPCSQAVRNAIEAAVSRIQTGEFGAVISDPDPDSPEWRAELEEADRRFAQAMAGVSVDFSGQVRAAA